MLTDTVRLGVELLKDLKNNSELKEALKQRLFREIKLNIEILADILKKNKISEEEFCQYVSILEIKFFEYLNDSLIGINKIQKKIHIKFSDYILEKDIKNKNYPKWTSDIDNNFDLLEKIYHRITITKSLAKIKRIKNRQSFSYIRFLSKAYLDMCKSN